MSKGTDDTRRFYDELGWTEAAPGRPVDSELFGVREDGPIRRRLHRETRRRVVSAVSAQGKAVTLLECGCGGAPAMFLLAHCAEYAGADFSETGLSRARCLMAQQDAVPFSLHNVDICSLPFDDDSFDVVYSAHMLYHIDSPEGQRRAIAEMHRVLAPGGVLILHVANPRPLLFPLRCLMRVVGESAALRRLFGRFKKGSLIPYRPQRISVMRAELARFGRTEVFTGGIPSTRFNQVVTEYRHPWKLLWKAIEYMHMRHPHAAAFLGNYVIYVAWK
jgi:ubiquinone/menaquinone biosynthesis C-methylase UbiE